MDTPYSSDENDNPPKVLEKPLTTRTGKRDHPEKFHILLPFKQWAWEVVFYILSAICVAGLVGLLIKYHGRPLDEWPLGISINSLISILTAFLYEFIKEPIGSAMSQLKYEHFRKRAHPLSDFERLDEASKSPFDSLKLILTRPYWIMPCLGALLTVSIIVVGPFIQEIISTPSRWTADSISPTMPIIRNFNVNIDNTFTNSFSAGNSLGFLTRSGVLGGLYGGGAVSDLSTNCSSSRNCTWPVYQSIMICGSCEDLSQNITTSTTPNGQAASLPNAHILHPSTVFNMTSNAPTLAFPSAGNVLVDFSIINQGANNTYQAFECFLQICLQNLTASSQNISTSAQWLGSVEEHVLANNTPDASITHNYWQSIVNATPALPPFVNGSAYTPESWPADFTINNTAAYALSAWLAPFFTGTVLNNLTATNDQSLFLSRVVSGAYPTTDVFETFANMVRNFSNVLRNFAPGGRTVPGTRRQQTPTLQVQWRWLALPVALMGFSLVVMAKSMWGAYAGRTPSWRGAVLPVLFHGLGEELRREGRVGTSVEEMEKVADGERVRLVRTDEVPERLLFVREEL